MSSFVERRHSKTSSFHLLNGDMSVTLYNLSCIIHLPITDRILDHNPIQRAGALEFMVTHLGYALGKAQKNIVVTQEAYTIFSFQNKNYEVHLSADINRVSDDVHAIYHRQYALKTFFCF